MPTETGARCILQMARQRRLSVRPGEFGLEQDICDVTLWLIEKHSLSRVHVWVDRHYTQIGRRRHRHDVTKASRAADPRSTRGVSRARLHDRRPAQTFTATSSATAITRGMRPSKAMRASRTPCGAGDHLRKFFGTSEEGGESRPFCMPFLVKNLPILRVSFSVSLRPGRCFARHGELDRGEWK